MQAILFHAIKLSSVAAREWRRFCQQTNIKVLPSREAQQLAENVWLIVGENNAIEQFLSVAATHEITCRTIEFDLVSEWQEHHPPRLA